MGIDWHVLEKSGKEDGWKETKKEKGRKTPTKISIPNGNRNLKTSEFKKKKRY